MSQWFGIKMNLKVKNYRSRKTIQDNIIFGLDIYFNLNMIFFIWINMILLYVYLLSCTIDPCGMYYFVKRHSNTLQIIILLILKNKTNI